MMLLFWSFGFYEGMASGRTGILPDLFFQGDTIFFHSIPDPHSAGAEKFRGLGFVAVAMPRTFSRWESGRPARAAGE